MGGILSHFLQQKPRTNTVQAVSPGGCVAVTAPWDESADKRTMRKHRVHPPPAPAGEAFRTGAQTAPSGWILDVAWMHV